MRGAYYRLALMVGVLVFLVIYGKKFADNFSRKFVAFTKAPPDAGTLDGGPDATDPRVARYVVPDGGAVSVDEMARLLGAAAPEARVMEALKHAASDDVFIAQVRALTTVASLKPKHRTVVGLQLATLLDSPLSPARLRAVVDALQFLSGKDLPPRASLWKSYWRKVDGGTAPLQ